MTLLEDVSRSFGEAIRCYDAFGEAMTGYLRALAGGDRIAAERFRERTVAALEAYLDCVAAAHGRLDAARPN